MVIYISSLNSYFKQSKNQRGCRSFRNAASSIASNSFLLMPNSSHLSLGVLSFPSSRPKCNPNTLCSISDSVSMVFTNAIRVMDAGRTLGYIPAIQATTLAPYMDAGEVDLIYVSPENVDLAKERVL